LAQIEGVSGRDRLGDILTKALGLTIPSSVLSLADELSNEGRTAACRSANHRLPKRLALLPLIAQMCLRRRWL
jgi:hypothetical protein